MKCQKPSPFPEDVAMVRRSIFRKSEWLHNIHGWSRWISRYCILVRQL